MPENRKVILSFNDGPAPIGALNTIFSMLKNESVKAEFYVLGLEIKTYPAATNPLLIKDTVFKTIPGVTRIWRKRVRTRLSLNWK